MTIMKSHPTEGRVATALLLLALVFLAGCQANGFPNLLAPTEEEAGSMVTLPGDPAALGPSRVERRIRDALEMARTKRLAEARYLLAQVRDAQPPGTEAYRAVTASLAVLALREGDMAAFRRLGRALDRALDDRVRIDPNYVGVVSLYRTVSGEGELPVNAGAAMIALKHAVGDPKKDGHAQAQSPAGGTATR